MTDISIDFYQIADSNSYCRRLHTMKRQFVWMTLWVITFSVAAQNTQDTTTTDTQTGLVLLPAIFSSPETGLGLGGAGLYYFDTGNPNGRPSSLQFAAIYTFKNQLLINNPFQYFDAKDKYWASGELSFFIFPFNYYGRGTDIDLDEFETFEARYIRFRLQVLRQVKKKHYIGPRYWLDHYFAIDTDPNGELRNGTILGSSPGTVSGLGVVGIIDQRNNIFSPSKGHYLEASVMRYSEALAGSFNFTTFNLDARKYYENSNGDEFGLQFFHNSTIGSVPFNYLARLGGGRTNRGYYEGAYNDTHYTTVQAEYRHYLFRKIIGAAFIGGGTVYPNIGSIDTLLPSAGFGFRYELKKKEKIRIRLDFAFGRDSFGFYLDFNEPF